MRARGTPERVVGIQYLVELEAVGDQQLWVKLPRLHGLEPDRRRDERGANGQASMRPRRARLGCGIGQIMLIRFTHGFNEAEARAPRMLG